MSPTPRSRAVHSPTSVPFRGISVREYASLRSIVRLVGSLFFPFCYEAVFLGRLHGRILAMHEPRCVRVVRAQFPRSDTQHRFHLCPNGFLSLIGKLQRPRLSQHR